MRTNRGCMGHLLFAISFLLFAQWVSSNYLLKSSDKIDIWCIILVQMAESPEVLQHREFLARLRNYCIVMGHQNNAMFSRPNFNTNLVSLEFMLGTIAPPEEITTRANAIVQELTPAVTPVIIEEQPLDLTLPRPVIPQDEIINIDDMSMYYYYYSIHVFHNSYTYINIHISLLLFQCHWHRITMSLRRSMALLEKRLKRPMLLPLLERAPFIHH